MTALIKIFQIKSFVDYNFDIKMLDLELIFIKLYFVLKSKEIRE